MTYRIHPELINERTLVAAEGCRPVDIHCRMQAVKGCFTEGEACPEMFHLQYPASKHFMTWDELGCLCRSMGFPGDLFRSSSYPDISGIKFNERGLEIESIHRMFDLNMMYQALNHTYNMHTANWNSCAMTTAIHLLGHRVLNFDGVHNARVAYMTYEHIDMKGMVLDRQILLQTLKMCGRAIAPLKLMHRIKHTKGEYEEKGRIQLHEFFGLILWCDIYKQYRHDDLETASGKDGDLFKLVDFHRLLSHHDEYIIKELNAQYLREERHFGGEEFGSKNMFNDSTVNTEFTREQGGRKSSRFLISCFHSKTGVNSTNSYVQMHKDNFSDLKHEVNQSQARVYKAHAGSVRPRPVSAPNLDMYRRKSGLHEQVDTSVQKIFESVRSRLHSACPRGNIPETNHPQTKKDVVRTPTPRVITPHDLSDMQCKMENLQFDMNTLVTRCQTQVENEMMFYLPGYLETLSSRKPNTVETKPHKIRKKQHWTSQITENLAYPRSNLGRTHAKNSDARFCGFMTVTSRPINSKNSKSDKFSKRPNSSTCVQIFSPDYVIIRTSELLTGKSKMAAKANLAATYERNIFFKSEGNGTSTKISNDERGTIELDLLKENCGHIQTGIPKTCEPVGQDVIMTSVTQIESEVLPVKHDGDLEFGNKFKEVITATPICELPSGIWSEIHKVAPAHQAFNWAPGSDKDHSGSRPRHDGRTTNISLLDNLEASKNKKHSESSDNSNLVEDLDNIQTTSSQSTNQVSWPGQSRLFHYLNKQIGKAGLYNGQMSKSAPPIRSRIRNDLRPSKF